MMDSWKLPVTPFIAHYEMKAAFVTTKNAKKRTSDSTSGWSHSVHFSVQSYICSTLASCLKSIIFKICVVTYQAVLSHSGFSFVPRIVINI